MLDGIVVGQGIAGSLLAWRLLQRGQSILVIDDDRSLTSSKISTGILNPTTGKTMRPVEGIDTLMPVAIQTYRELEDQFSENLLNEIPIYRVFQNPGQQNDWCTAMQQTAYAKHFSSTAVQSLNEKVFVNPYGACCVRGGYQIRAAILLQSLHRYFRERQSLLCETFDYSELSLTNDMVQYKTYRARYLVFCEGWRAAANPFFPDVPFQPAKGELLRIRSKELPSRQILMSAAVISPTENQNEFDVGSIYEWKFDTDSPTEINRKLLLDMIANSIRVRYEVVSHTAAIRPTVSGRKPYAGFHPHHPQLGIVNGLGTRGFLLAPYYALQFADNLAPA